MIPQSRFVALLPCLVLHFVSVLFLPTFRVSFFIPYLITVFYRSGYLAALWHALWVGTFLDLLGVERHLGLHALNYVVVSLFLYRQKQHFFEDSLFTLSLMTGCFSLLSTLLQVVLLDLFEGGLQVNLTWLTYDVLVMSVVDTAYAFVCFSLPQLAWRWRRDHKRPSDERNSCPAL